MKKLACVILASFCVLFVLGGSVFALDLDFRKGDKMSPAQERRVLMKIFTSMVKAGEKAYYTNAGKGNQLQFCKIEGNGDITTYTGVLYGGSLYVSVDIMDMDSIDEKGRIKKSKKTDYYKFSKKRKRWEHLKIKTLTTWDFDENEKNENKDNVEKEELDAP